MQAIVLRCCLVWVVILSPVTLVWAQSKNRESETYPAHLDSKLREGTPFGEVLPGEFNDSQIYPGTKRNYWIYVPKEVLPSGWGLPWPVWQPSIFLGHCAQTQ